MSLDGGSIDFTNRMGLNWFSLVIVQWMNFGLLCIAMVVNSVATEKYPDPVNNIYTEEQLPSPKEALDQLNVRWEKVARDCNLTADERDHLMFFCIQNLYKVYNNRVVYTLADYFKQVLQSHELEKDWSVILSDAPQEKRLQALCQYERIIHINVFMPAWKSVKVNL